MANPLQNFVDLVGPPVSAEWLNGVDVLANSVFQSAMSNSTARAGLFSDNPLEINNGGTAARTVAQAQINLGIGALIAGALSQSAIGTLLYPPIPAEAGITIVNSWYWPGDPRRYDADATGVNDSTAAVQTAINVAGATNGIVYIGVNCTYLTGPLTWQAAGNNDTLWIMGCGFGSSILLFNGTTGTHLTLTGAAAALAINEPTSAQVRCTGFLMNGQGYTNATVAIAIQALSQWKMDAYIVEYGTGYSLQSALSGIIDGVVYNNNIGILARRLSSNAYCNNVQVTAIMGGNVTYAIDVGQGQGWEIDGDIEGNGTSGNASTGAIIIRSTTGAEAQVAKFTIRGWLEANHGWTINCESNNYLDLVLKPRGIMFGDGVAGGGLLNVPNGLKGLIEGCESSADSTDVVTVNFDTISVRESSLINFTDTSNYPYYEGAFLNVNPPVDARITTPTLTFSNGASGTVSILQRGKRITVICSAAIHNTGAFTTPLTATGITGILIPSVTRQVPAVIYNNGAMAAGWVSVASGTGLLTIVWYAGAQTTGQDDGLGITEFSYDL